MRDNKTPPKPPVHKLPRRCKIASYSEIFTDGSMHISFVSSEPDRNVETLHLSNDQILLLYRSLTSELTRYRTYLLQCQEALAKEKAQNSKAPTSQPPTNLV